MDRKVIVVVLAWWFMFSGAGHSGPATFGPFVDQAQCEQLRFWASGQYGGSRYWSWCWWDGKL